MDPTPAGHSPAGHSPAGHSPAGHSPAGHSPAGHSPAGHSPAGHSPAGHSPAGHSHEPDHDAAHHVNAHVKGYLIVGGILIFCTGLTVWLSFWNFGSQDANIIVAMVLATFKVGCVAAIFMHLKSEKWTIYRILLITVLFAIGLFALTGLAFSDPIRLNW